MSSQDCKKGYHGAEAKGRGAKDGRHRRGVEDKHLGNCGSELNDRIAGEESLELGLEVIVTVASKREDG